MEALKQLFADKALTWDEFSSALEDKGIKLADLGEGRYVDKKKYKALDADYKKQLADKQKELDNLKAQDNSEDVKKQIETLQKEKSELEAKQKETSSALDRMTKRELAVNKTGITDPDFLDLVMSRHGSKDIDEFEKQVVAYAEASKAKWGKVAPSPDLNGEPAGNSSGINKEKLMKAAGAWYKDKDKKG